MTSEAVSCSSAKFATPSHSASSSAGAILDSGELWKQPRVSVPCILDTDCSTCSALQYCKTAGCETAQMVCQESTRSSTGLTGGRCARASSPQTRPCKRRWPQRCVCETLHLHACALSPALETEHALLLCSSGTGTSSERRSAGGAPSYTTVALVFRPQHARSMVKHWSLSGGHHGHGRRGASLPARALLNVLQKARGSQQVRLGFSSWAAKAGSTKAARCICSE